VRNYVAAGLAAVLMGTGVLIAAAPPASAGCTDRGDLVCDGPIMPDGVWKRCLEAGSRDAIRPTCWLLGPGHLPPWYVAALPPNHIDDQPAAAPAAPPPLPPPAPPVPPPPPAPAPLHP